MPYRIRSLSAAALGLALTFSAAHAQLMLSGQTTGSFVNLAEANTTVINGTDGSWAGFQTGIPMRGSTQSRIEFTNSEFSNVSSGQPIQVGLFSITNGDTQLGTGAATALFDLGVNLTTHEARELALTQLTFHIDHTPNRPGAVPDTFSVTFAQPAAVKIGDTLVQFHVNFDPSEFQIAENATVQRGDVSVSFTPVPEPSTYAAFGAALLLGVVAYRRYRGGKTIPKLPAAA